MQFENYVTWYC